MEQGSREWHEARSGRITASRAADVMAFTQEGVYKTGPKKGQPKPVRELKARSDYRAELVAEILSGQPSPNIRAAALAWGQDVEAAARVAYEADRGIFVTRVAIVQHPSLPHVSCSPDGLVDDDGMVQIKAPHNTANHIDALTDGVPAEHLPQMQFELWVTGRKWNDFISFDPRMPEHMALYVERVERDEAYIAALAAECAKFWESVQRIVTALRKRYELAEAA